MRGIWAGFRFGHVSPTTAEHVVADLGEHGIYVLTEEGGKPCTVGIESTVARIDPSDRSVR
jgi:L-threonylcarbamoyladenylate synthase